jgi:hypothetical protein
VSIPGGSGRFISGSRDGTVREWHLGEEAPLRVMENPDGPVTALAISSDGGSLAVGGHLIAWWDLAGWELLRTAGSLAGAVQSVALTPCCPAATTRSSRHGTSRPRRERPSRCGCCRRSRPCCPSPSPPTGGSSRAVPTGRSSSGLRTPLRRSPRQDHDERPGTPCPRGRDQPWSKRIRSRPQVAGSARRAGIRGCVRVRRCSHPWS